MKTEGRHFMFLAKLSLAISTFCLVLILLNCMVQSVSVHAADNTEEEGTYTISSAEDFESYSLAYSQGNRNPNDTINISISSGNRISNANFISLGTASRPFAGTLNISTSGVDTFDLSDIPLFDYVSTDLKITGSGVVKIMRSQGTTGGALFANHVVAGSSSANWSVTLVSYDGQESQSESYTGLIGEIGKDATVNMTFTNNVAIPISSTENVGLVCGTMKENSTLSVSVLGSASSLSVSTTGGDAGGLVGRMLSGSTLKIVGSGDISSKVSTITTTASNKYAGGIVGYCESSTVTLDTSVTSYNLGTVTANGKVGAGGLFGYYKNTQGSYTFDCNLFPFTKAIVAAETSVGAIFGSLENNGDLTITNTGSDVITSELKNATNRGGIAGTYTSDILARTLLVTGVSTDIVSSSTISTGGVIGSLINRAVYVSFSNIESTINEGLSLVNNDKMMSGGLIGLSGTNGSFIDVIGNVTISGEYAGGLVGKLDDGCILRLSGVTDVSGLSGEMKPKFRGHLIYFRTRSLVYAKGDGCGSGWTIKRNPSLERPVDNFTDDSYYGLEDILSWGQVIRLDGTTLEESNLFTVDSTAHTVTVKAAVTNISTITDFARTSINMQLNTGDNGALRFDSGSKRDNLLIGTISLGADIDLSGTGLTGLMRDDANGNAFSGTFNGNGHTITLTLGEVYGCQTDGTPLVDIENIENDGTSSFGYVSAHTFIGLFSKIGNGASISNLTLNGYINIAQGKNLPKIGFLAGEASGTITLNNVSVSGRINHLVKYHDDNSYIGGAIGYINGGSITITGGTYKPTIRYYVIPGSNQNNPVYFGGFAGFITNSNQTITISGTTISTIFERPNDASLSFNKPIQFGGLIGYIDGTSYSVGKKNITLTNVTVDKMNASIKIGSGEKNFLSVLGSSWYGTDVTINGLTIRNTTLTAKSDSITGINVGALVQTATGHWEVNSISVEGLTITASGTNSSFAFLVNNAMDSQKTGMLYIDVDNTDSNYDIEGLTITSGTTFTVFDELVAYSDAEADGTSGHAIVSVTTTDGELISTDGTCNTYLNHTNYGKSNHSINKYSRYYYNLKSIRGKVSPTPAEKFLLSTVRIYAHSSIQSFFSETTTFTGSLDLRGYSYYPVNGSGFTFNDVTLFLDNQGVESSSFSDSDSGYVTRTTLSYTSQHYLMHTSLFINYTGSLTIDGMIICGNVPLINGASGFLVRGTISGSSLSMSNINISDISLGKNVSSTYTQALIYSNGTTLSTNVYAPLLINKIDSYTVVAIEGVTHPGYGTSFSGYAASSLIGDVGTSSSSNITMDFSNICIDGRIANNQSGDFSAYDTSKSIFSRSTILNSFIYFSDCSASYTFTVSDDWGSKTGTNPLHNVTYGLEISGSIEYSDLQNKYYPIDRNDKPPRYVNYESNSNSENVSFSGFLPYVYDVWSNGELKTNYHEIMINVTLEGALTQGCGKYGDPYIVTDGSQFEMISVILTGVGLSKSYQINLPSSFDYSTACSNNHVLYQFNGTEFVSDGQSNKSLDDVRKYVAGAYYTVSSDITLSHDFKGLGRPSENYESSYICPYAFRGVIVGTDYTPVDEEGNPTGEATRKPIITNASENPFIYSSNGSVVKDLTILVQPSEGLINLTVPDIQTIPQTILYTGGLAAYGGVIGRIMGGDSVIDNVRVQFGAISFRYDRNWAVARLIPIGGYVGVILNGGLIFRNMVDTAGLTSSKFDKIANAGDLYANPFIGRVIDGYAFNETNAYHEIESTTTLKNGQKNYSIPDLVVPNSDSLKLQVSKTNKLITIPNVQALHILSLIINSGLGSATSVSGDYANWSSTPWIASREYTVSRGSASYSALGDGTSADCTLANQETATYTSRNKIPYLISHYTLSESSSYYARIIGTVKDYSITLVSGNTYSLPEAYRGIGNIYYFNSTIDNDYTKLRFVSFDGKNCTITHHTRYQEYEQKNSLMYKAATARVDQGNLATAGLGLFNQLIQKSASESNAIKNLTISGSIFYDVYNTNGNRSTYKNDSSENGVLNYNRADVINDNRTYLSVGGFAGYSHGMFYIKDVVFDNLTVESAHGSGGLLGFVGGCNSNSQISKIIYTVPNIGNVNAIGVAFAGGIIGRIDLLYVDIIGLENNRTTLHANVSNKSTTWNDRYDKWEGEVYSGIGGLVGNVKGYSASKQGSSTLPKATGGNTANKMRSLNISNMSVKSPSNETYSISTATASIEYETYAGGLIGSMQRIYVIIRNCSVENINIHGHSAGGLVGHASQCYYLGIYDSLIDGNNKTYSITGDCYASGIIGRTYAHDEYMMYFDGVSVDGYNIISSVTGNNASASAGVLGRLKCDQKELNPFVFRNISINNCLIQSSYTDNGNNRGTAGLVGVTENNKVQIHGYNILISDTEISGTVSAPNVGSIIGYNTNAVVKLVGVSTAGMTIADANNSSMYTKNSGYVIFADYNGIKTNESLTAIDDASTSSDNHTNVEVKDPYVVINPHLTTGGSTLMGDGIAGSVANLPIQSILSNSLYAYSKSAYYNGSSGTTNEGTFRLYLEKLAMFSSEANYQGTDFPILILESIDHTQSHSMINSYLRLLTNTVYDYGNDTTNIYEIRIYNFAYNGETFVPSINGASLKRTNGKFYMSYSEFDSGSNKVQCSLIDIRFYDPTNTSNVAYHLYVPVFVKKVLTYRFDLAVLGGSTYLKENYSNYGRALIENIGTPVTLYFKYTYSKTLAEWQEAINGGESVERNYNKTLNFTKANNSDVLSDLPSNTVLVLVSPNKGGIPYYATIGTALSNGVINLGAFRSSMSKEGNNYTFSGDYFESEYFSNLMTITVSSSGSGTLVATSSNDATLRVDGQGYRLATSDELANSNITKYTASVSGNQESVITEDYFLTFMTESTENYDLFHYFLVTSPASFSDQSYPSKIQDTGSHTMVHLIMGKIFYHDDLSVSSTSGTGDMIMSENNNELNVSMSVRLGLSDDLDSAIKEDLRGLLQSVNVYQAFHVYLNRCEGGVTRKVIMGSPSISESQYIIISDPNGNATGVPNVSYSVGDMSVNHNYAEWISTDLASYFASEEKFKIISLVVISYPSGAIPVQFPSQTELNQDDGVTVSISSGIAFSKSNVSTSKNVILLDERPQKIYYSEAELDYAILDVNPIGDRVGSYTPLGINALNIEGADQTHATFDLLPVLGISAIADGIEDYQSAVITLQLSQRQNDGSYGNKIDIVNYLSVLYEGGTNSDVTSPDNNHYSMTISRSSGLLENNGAEIILPILHVTVETGSLLESAGHTYGNYRIDVTVTLYDSSGNAYTVSTASNYVIYTNVKVIPDFID